MAIRINLDKEVEKLIHFPRFEGTPLYTRIPGCMEGYANTQEDVSTKSLAWIKWSHLSYGSPNNIRRVFITSKGVKTHLYQPIVNKGSKGKNTSLKRENQFSSFKADEVVQSILSGQNEYIVTRTGFNALASPWVASNIEELYFDWTVLLSDDVMNMGKGNLLAELTATSNTGITRSTLPYELFEFACLKGQDIRTKFPRLRVIGYIQQLDRVYNMVDYKGGAESIEEMGKLWCANRVVKAAGADANCRVLIYDVPGVKRLNTDYRKREGIYSYDAEVLLPYFEDRKIKINEYKSKMSKPQEIVTTKSEIEITLDEMYERDGVEFIAKTIKVMFTNKEDGKQALNEMSTGGKNRYSRMFQ